MYGALWRLLPGPAWARVIILVVLAAIVLLACVVWIFPLLQPYLSPAPDVTVNK